MSAFAIDDAYRIINELLAVSLSGKNIAPALHGDFSDLSNGQMAAIRFLREHSRPGRGVRASIADLVFSNSRGGIS